MIFLKNESPIWMTRGRKKAKKRKSIFPPTHLFTKLKTSMSDYEGEEVPPAPPVIMISIDVKTLAGFDYGCRLNSGVGGGSS